MIKHGTERRTLAKIQYYPDPKEILEALKTRTGWPYKMQPCETERERVAEEKRIQRYRMRDKALCALLYLGALRISEALPIRKNQFSKKTTERGTYWEIRGIRLSKARVKGRPRKEEYRIATLPLEGERAELTKLVMDYVEILKPDERLFPWSLEQRTYTVKPQPDGIPRISVQVIGAKRAWQITHALLPEFTEHWLRAFSENYLYQEWDRDLLAVADYCKVSPRTLEKYIRKRSEKYAVA